MKTKPILSEHETALMMAAAVAEAKNTAGRWPSALWTMAAICWQ